jgi:hypothetical protein
VPLNKELDHGCLVEFSLNRFELYSIILGKCWKEIDRECVASILVYGKRNLCGIHHFAMSVTILVTVI